MRFLFSIVVLGIAAIYYAFKKSGGYKWVYGNGRLVEVSEQIDPYQRISVHNNIELEVLKGSTNELVIEIDENLVDYLNVYTEAGCLHLGIQADVLLKRCKIKAKVRVEGLKSLRGTGATVIDLASGVVDPDQFDLKLTGACSFNGNIRSDEIAFQSSGAANCNLAVEANKLSLKLSGATDLKAFGNIDALELKTSGASSLKGKDLNVNSAYIDLSGASSAKIKVNKYAEVSASGGSDIVLLGKPVIGKEAIGGASSFKIK